LGGVKLSNLKYREGQRGDTGQAPQITLLVHPADYGRKEAWDKALKRIRMLILGRGRPWGRKTKDMGAINEKTPKKSRGLLY